MLCHNFLETKAEVTYQSSCRRPVSWLKTGVTLSRGVCRGTRRPRGLGPMGLHKCRRKISKVGEWSQSGGGDMTTGWGEGGRERSRRLAWPG